MQHALTITGLKKRFGKKVALDGLNMNVPKKSVYGFLGENGAGKTTTFSILGGFLSTNAGHFNIEGKMGMLPQDARFSPGRKIGSQLKLLARLSGVPTSELNEEINRVLKAVNMEKNVNLPIEKCSHGMYKRVGIAQALLGSPNVILLDEPTAGLDPKTAYEIRRLIETLNHQKTVVVSSHNLSEIEQMCDTVGIINNGKMAFEGPVAELVGKSSLLQIELDRKPDLTSLQAIEGVVEAEWSEKQNRCNIQFDRKHHPLETINTQLLSYFLKNGIGVRCIKLGQSLEHEYLKKLAVN